MHMLVQMPLCWDAYLAQTGEGCAGGRVGGGRPPAPWLS
jgi:hypothetical protein